MDVILMLDTNKEQVWIKFAIHCFHFLMEHVTQ